MYVAHSNPPHHSPSPHMHELDHVQEPFDMLLRRWPVRGVLRGFLDGVLQLERECGFVLLAFGFRTWGRLCQCILVGRIHCRPIHLGMMQRRQTDQDAFRDLVAFQGLFHHRQEADAVDEAFDAARGGVAGNDDFVPAFQRGAEGGGVAFAFSAAELDADGLQYAVAVQPGEPFVACRPGGGADQGHQRYQAEPACPQAAGQTYRREKADRALAFSRGWLRGFGFADGFVPHAGWRRYRHFDFYPGKACRQCHELLRRCIRLPLGPGFVHAEGQAGEHQQ